MNQTQDCKFLFLFLYISSNIISHLIESKLPLDVDFHINEENLKWSKYSNLHEEK